MALIDVYQKSIKQYANEDVTLEFIHMKELIEDSIQSKRMICDE